MKEYLEREYPFEGKAYLLLRIAFFNDYHRHCRDTLLYALSRLNAEMASKITGAKLIGGAIYDAYDWLQHVDPALKAMIHTREDRIALEAYLQVSPIRPSEDKVSTIVYGEGYLESIRAAVSKAMSEV